MIDPGTEIELKHNKMLNVPNKGSGVILEAIPKELWNRRFKRTERYYTYKIQVSGEEYFVLRHCFDILEKNVK
jgi:hypothetical protein